MSLLRTSSLLPPVFSSRAFWLRQMRQWHWISAAVCLIGMLLFAVTGITLNHAAQIEAKPSVVTRDEQLPADLIAALKAEVAKGKALLPSSLQSWLSERMSVDVRGRDAEWSPEDIYVSLPRPGGDAWLSIDRESGEVRYETTDRGWISYLNDLHKARNTGAAWSWFIDIFAIACVVFCITGFVLLYLMAGARRSTWPLVALGFVVPALLAIFFIH